MSEAFSAPQLGAQAWGEEELADLGNLCDWLLEEPAQGPEPIPQQPSAQQLAPPPPRPLAATFPRPAAAAAPSSAAVSLQPAGAPAASPFAAAFLQTPLMTAPEPTRRTRPRLSPAASAPTPGVSSDQALSWVLAMGKLAESQGVAATPPPLSCPWEHASLPLPSRPPSPPSAHHVADVRAPRPTHSSRSLERSSSSSVAAENGSPVVCTAEVPCHSMDLLELLGTAPPPQLEAPPLPPRGSGTAASYRGIGSYGTQRSAPLPQLPPCGGGYDRLPAARVLPTVQQQAAAVGLHRAASGSIGRKRLCTWEEVPEETTPGPRRSLPAPLPPPAEAWQQAQQAQQQPAMPPPVDPWQQAPQVQQQAAVLPPAAEAWQQAQEASLEASFEAQRQRLTSLLAQLQQVRVALQQEAAPLPQQHLASQQQQAPAPASAPLHHLPPLPAGGHRSWPAAAWHEPTPFFD